MLHDIRFGLRSLARSPLFAGGAIATLALGIGVNATIFSLVSSALLRPLPGIASADRMVWISSVWREEGRLVGLSYPDYADYRDASRDVFVDMLAFRLSPLSLGSGGDPERIRGQAISGSFFRHSAYDRRSDGCSGPMMTCAAAPNGSSRSVISCGSGGSAVNPTFCSGPS